MPLPAPRALLENRNLAFVGERVRATAAIPQRLADRMLGTRNPHGKPNADVLRRVVNATQPTRVREQWMIDFPPGMPEAEAALYEHPFHHLYQTLGTPHGPWWFNPHAHPALRAALARRERFLATPIGASPAFRWFDSTLLPDDSLVVVARDDDFMHGVLSSRIFALWWTERHSRRTPTLALDSFPFPWPPATPLHALTREQEEQRLAIAQAARTGNTALIDAAVCAAYGWPADLADSELLTHTQDLHRQRTS